MRKIRAYKIKTKFQISLFFFLAFTVNFNISFFLFFFFFSKRLKMDKRKCSDQMFGPNLTRPSYSTSINYGTLIGSYRLLM